MQKIQTNENNFIFSTQKYLQQHFHKSYSFERGSGVLEWMEEGRKEKFRKGKISKTRIWCEDEHVRLKVRWGRFALQYTLVFSISLHLHFYCFCFRYFYFRHFFSFDIFPFCLFPSYHRNICNFQEHLKLKQSVFENLGVSEISGISQLTEISETESFGNFENFGSCRIFRSTEAFEGITSKISKISVISFFW